MCGIVGYLNLNSQPLDPHQPVLDRMCQSIRHRGPDEQGTKTVGPVALGMTRLAIIDVETGQQPIANETQEIWLVFNGEIYNFQDLRRTLVDKGHRFSTQSDTETIVHLYEEHKFDCVKHLEGMFAFALFDTRSNTLFLARDRMGEKPLHWAILDNQFVFSSEIKGVLTHDKSKRELNPDALQAYLSLEYVPAPMSIFKGINKLPPAHFMVVKDGQVVITRYWEPAVAPVELSPSEASKRLIEVLERSTKLRLISDVPLGIFLSGGIDSSSVAALAARHTQRKLRTFSIGFADSSFDESRYAKEVSEWIGTEHESIMFEPALALDTLTELWSYLDEPMADASILPTYFLSKMTRRSVTVALSGEGGDELFGGYPTYQAHRLSTLWNLVPRQIMNKVLEPIINGLPVSLNNLSLDYKLKRFIAGAGQPPLRRHLRWMGAIPLSLQSTLLQAEIFQSPGYNHTFQEEELFSDLPRRLYGTSGKLSADVIDLVMRLDMTTYLPDDLLFKADRASMAASLETRLPFLAYPVVEFALSLPSSLKLRGLTTKYLLKEAVAPLLPPHVIKRPKKGFGIPVAKWIRSEFRSVVDEYLCPSFIQKQGIFNSDVVDRLLKEHDEQRIDHRKELWTLLMFQCWWSRFLQSA